MVHLIHLGNISENIFQVRTGAQNHQGPIMEESLENTLLQVSEILNIRHGDRLPSALQEDAMANINDPETRHQNDP